MPYVAWGAFALAFVFGAVANKTDFCTMGAVSDWVNMGHTGRMRMWLLAIGVAILGANALHLAGALRSRAHSLPLVRRRGELSGGAGI